MPPKSSKRRKVAHRRLESSTGYLSASPLTESSDEDAGNSGFKPGKKSGAKAPVKKEAWFMVKLNKLGDQVQSLEKENEELRREKVELQHEVESLRIEKENDRWARAQEIQASRASAIDRFSDAEIANLAMMLNYSVQQASAGIAEAFEFDSESGLRAGEQVDKFELQGWLSDYALDLVMNRASSSYYQVKVQTVLQESITRLCTVIVHSWSAMGTDEANDVLGYIFASIRKTEPPAVARSWKTLTKVHGKIKLHTQSKEVTRRDLSKHIARTLSLAGATNVTDIQVATNIIEEQFRTRLTEVVERCFELDKVLGESDVHIFLPMPYTPYEPENMDMVVDETSGSEQLFVASACELGLVKVETHCEPHRRRMILKAGVVVDDKPNDSPRRSGA